MRSTGELGEVTVTLETGEQSLTMRTTVTPR
ncbi:hypothetical protein ACFSTC_11925 [Nonomuraea ferruginea]